MRKLFLSALFVVSILPLPTLAGVFEVGLSTSFKNSNIDAYNYTRTTATTASLSYFFGAMSAIEYSYTSGQTLQAIRPFGTTEIIRGTSTVHGLDLVFSFSERGSAFQPFIKAGAAQLHRENFYSNDSQPEFRTAEFNSTVPSAGLGLRIRLTKTFSIKAGIDGWSVDESKPLSEWDHAGRVGLSWIF